MRLLLMVGILVVWSLSGPSAIGQSVTIDHIDGLHGGNPLEILADGTTTISFYIRFTGDAESHGGFISGFRVYSEDGASWTTTESDTLGLGKAQFDGGVFFSSFSADGIGADTVGWGGFRFFASGLPAGYDDIALVISIGPIDPSQHGKTICIDSSFFRPSGVWSWAGPDVFPSWDGEKCLTCIDPTMTGVDDTDNTAIPDSYVLSQNYPNPFNPSTLIEFEIPKRSHVELSVYNLLGQEIVRIIDEELPSGVHRTSWNGLTRTGKTASTGVYYYRLKTEAHTEAKKMLLLK